jgi:type II secretory pathway component PulC
MTMKTSVKIGIREAYVYRHKPECARALANFYWRVLLSVALCILVFSLVYGIHKLFSVIAENDRIFSQGVNTVQPVPKLDKAQLQSTLSAFQDRSDRFNSLRSGAQKISDPSSR